MSYLAPFLLFIGLVLFVFGTYGLYSVLFNKILFQSDLKSLPKKINFEDSGNYYLSLSYTNDVSNIEFNLKNPQVQVDFIENSFKFKFYRKKIKWAELFKFNISTSGEYTLDLYNGNNQLNSHCIITKAISNFKKISYIISIVIGFNLLGFGILIITSLKFHDLIFSHF